MTETKTDITAEPTETKPGEMTTVTSVLEKLMAPAAKRFALFVLIG